MIFPGMPDGSEPTDPTLPDGIVAISTRSWFDLILRMDVHPTCLATAASLARFASPDGSRVFPGAQKIADMVGRDDSVAREWINFLRDMKLLVLKKRGGGRPRRDGKKKPKGSEYRLTRPADLTTLPLWLDPAFDRIPDGAGFTPAAEEPGVPADGEDAPGPGKHRAPTHNEKRRRPAKQRPQASADTKTEEPEHRSPASAENEPGTTEPRSPASAETTTPTEEHRAPASADSEPTDTELRSPASADEPVDNPGAAETPLVSDGNSACLEPKLRLPVPRDLDRDLDTRPNPFRSPQVTDSLGPGPDPNPAAGAVPPPSLLAAAALDGDGTAAGHVDAAAEILAARAALGSSGDAARWRAAARKALAARDRHNPADHLVTVVAGELYRRALTATAHHPDTVIMNGAS